MDQSPILSNIHTVTIGKVVNNNGGNNKYGLKMLRVNRPLSCRHSSSEVGAALIADSGIITLKLGRKQRKIHFTISLPPVLYTSVLGMLA